MHPFLEVGSWKIPTYGVLMMVGLLTASCIGLVRVRRAGLMWENAVILIAGGFGCAIAGAAGLYIAVSYSLEEIINMLKSGELFESGRVGLVFYGGFICAGTGVLLLGKLMKIPLEKYALQMVPCIPLGHAFGRVGCFFAGCCYGIPSDSIFAVTYPEGLTNLPAGIPLFPVQLLESLILLVIFFILIRYSAKTPCAIRVVSLYLILYAICRFGLELLRYDSIRGSWQGFSTSQWISVALLMLGAMLWLKSSVLKRE